MALLEREKHVVKSADGWPKRAWCGAKIWENTWAFIDLKHAYQSKAMGSPLTICPACQEAISSGHES